MQSRTYKCETCGIQKTATYNKGSKSKFKFCSVKCNGVHLGVLKVRNSILKANQIKEVGSIKCSKCHIPKKISDFYSDNRRPLGIQSHCKECFKEQHKEYRKNVDYKNWYKSYVKKEHVIESNRKRVADWHKTERGKDYMKKYRSSDKFKAYMRKYEKEYRKNPIARQKDSILFNKYRVAKITSSDNTVTNEAVTDMLINQSYECNLCGASLLKVKKHLDHIIPISKGGIHTITNVQWLCYVCNIRKSNKMPY